MSAPSQVFLVGDWCVDPELDELRRNTTVVKLEPRATRVLCCLAERPGEVWSVEELLDRVWPGVVVGQNSVYQTVGQLRRAFGDLGEESQYIATVPRRGYRLIAPVTRCAPAVPTQASAQIEATAPEPAHGAVVNATVLQPGGSPLTGWMRTIAGRATVLVAALALLGALALFTWRGSTSDTRTLRPSVAVLPFADFSADRSSGAFCEGLTDEVIGSLGRVPGLRVTGRTSVYSLTQRRIDPQEIAKKLGVTHVLLGSVRPEEGRVRISARLVSAADGFQVWANSYDRKFTGAVAVQTDIARAVVDSLRLRLSAAELEAVGRAPTVNLNAYDLYLLGRHQQLQRTPESLQRAIDYHQRAISEDPQFALAHAGLSDAYMARFYYSNVTLAETTPLVETQVEAALGLDPELAEAYAARAVLRMEQKRTDDAIADLQRAIAINPNVAEFYLRLGAAHEYSGRPREALGVYDQVESLDPLHTQLHVRRCIVLRTLQRFDDADRACVRGFELQPGIPNALWARALNALAQGDLEKAALYYGQALDRAPHRADIRTEFAIVELDRGLIDPGASAFAMASEDAGAWRAVVEVEALRVYVARGDNAGLIRELRAAKWLEDAGATVLLRAAYLAITAGDDRLAEQLRARAVGAADFSDDAIQPDGYDLCWGRCVMCGLALLERRRGNVEAADRYTQLMLQQLERAESAGQTSGGLHYVRATLLAQQGNHSAAISELGRAAASGWRRGWDAARDPAFVSLYGNPGFTRALAQLVPSATPVSTGPATRS